MRFVEYKEPKGKKVWIVSKKKLEFVVAKAESLVEIIPSQEYRNIVKSLKEMLEKEETVQRFFQDGIETRIDRWVEERRYITVPGKT